MALFLKLGSRGSTNSTFLSDGEFFSQLFFQNKAITEEEAFVLFVRKNAIQVLIPKYGLEGTVFMAKDATGVVFNEEVIFPILLT